jgi:hypothetical protein
LGFTLSGSHRQRCGSVDQLAVGRRRPLAACRTVPCCGGTSRVDVPTLGGGRDQHRSADRAGLAQRRQKARIEDERPVV